METAEIDLVGALVERWSGQVEAAEYIPFRVRRRVREGASRRAEDED